MAHEAPSASISYKWSNDVFISFRGLDTRFNFTRHLLDSLCEKGLCVFLNDEKTTQTRVCLQELVQILEISQEGDQLVFPVFYDVDPSEVQHQRGSYAKALARVEERFIHKKLAEKIHRQEGSRMEAGPISSC
ncbi:hypothetical protein K1719_017717 [Acacia pycnantha]|nr:hypothetical protein K1719_017717 [Acacia pycnantha]